MNKIYETLSKINVNEKTERKNGLTYLSWAWAWAEVKKHFDKVTYEVTSFEGKPYLFDEDLGYMVETTVFIEDETISMMLPVMDNNNKAMTNKDYTITFASGKKMTVKKATMFDINTAIMRCLVKNLSMFGLGAYIYAGEDLPEFEKEEEKNKAEEEMKKSAEEAKKRKYIGDTLMEINGGDKDKCAIALKEITDKQLKFLEGEELQEVVEKVVAMKARLNCES